MFKQPVQSAKAFLDRIRSRFQPRAGTRATPLLFSVAALVPPPLADLAAGPVPTESPLLATIAVLAGLLGLSTGLLYRRMHHDEETVRSRAQNAEAELRALSMMTDDAVLVIAPDGTVRAGNPAAEEVFGISTEEFIGNPLTDLIAQPLCLPELTKNGPINFESTAKRGAEFVRVEMLVTPVEFGGITSYLALIHEIRGAAAGDSEQPAKHAALVKAVEKFTHDLNNEFTNLIGNLSVFLMSAPSDSANHERILNAKRSALRAQALNQKLQGFDARDGADGDRTQAGATPSCTILPMPNVDFPNPSEVRNASPRKPRVLILDDEEDICTLVCAALSSMDFDVAEATSVAAAIRIVDEAQKAGRPFELVISDLSLPGGVNGREAVKRLKGISPNLKAVVSSGYENDPVMRDCELHGFAAAVAKPYEIARLARVVREVLAADPATARKSA